MEYTALSDSCGYLLDLMMPFYRRWLEVSFSIDSLERLVGLGRKIHADDVTIIEQKDHGNAWSFILPI